MSRRGLVLSGAVVIGVCLPFVPLLLWSMSERWFYPALIPQQFGLRAWTYVFDTAASQILGGLWTSFALAATVTGASLVIGIPAGRALGLYDFPGKRLTILLVSLPIVVPPLSVAMGLHLWFLRLGLAESLTGVVLVHLTVCVPYVVFVMWGVFADYNPDFEDQARTLGASRLQVVTGVMLPMVLPGIAVAGLFSFLLSWSQYLSTLIIGGGKLLSLPILLFALMDSGDRPVAAAVSLVFVAPAFVALLFSTSVIGRRGLQGIR